MSDCTVMRVKDTGWGPMQDPFKVVRDFELALKEYTGAPYAVTTTSCTMALLLSVAWHLWGKVGDQTFHVRPGGLGESPPEIEIPKHTYVGVPMSIIHAGGWPCFREERWVGAYQLAPLPVIDSARWFTGDMYNWMAENIIGHAPGKAILGRGFICCSFHWKKTLGVEQGGVILHDDPEADAWLRRARFDGRSEGVNPKEDIFAHIGWHAYMSPETAAAGLVRLASLPKHNAPLPWGPGTDSDYPDLSTLEVFK